MDIEVPPIDQASAILGEHYRNYVVLFQDDDDPTGYDIAYSDPYSAKGLLEAATKYHNTYLEGGTELDDFEWSELDDEDEDEE
jgi:hypothetical protein